MQKCQERKAVFGKGSFNADLDKEKWRSVLTLDLMSSDESGQEGEQEVIISHPLPWLSANVGQFMRKLDEVALKAKSPRAIRQMKGRLEGSPSQRPRPEEKDLPTWVFNI